MSYDAKCYELAEYFLPSQASERIKSALAQAIQDAVEDYCVGEAVNLQAAIDERATRRAAIYSRPECIFHYCPHEDLCKAGSGTCICPKANS